MADKDKYKTVKKLCETCGNEFLITPSDAKRGRGKFCSLACSRPGASKCNHTFFREPSPAMAWVLGLVFSDGCLLEGHKGHRARLSIKSIDYQMLYAARRVSENETKIFNSGQTQTGKRVYRLEWSHPQIISDVKMLGITPRKSLTAEFPRSLPRKYWIDFIRGLFDGDGHVSAYKDKRRKMSFVRQWVLLGTHNMLEPIPNVFGLKNTIHPYQKIFRLRYYSLGDLRSIYEQLYYAKELPCLERKKQKFLEAITVGVDSPIEVDSFKRENHGLQQVNGYTKGRYFPSLS